MGAHISKETGEIKKQKQKVIVLTEDKEDVGEDRADHRGLDEPELVLFQGDDADDELDGVAKGCIEESSEGLSRRDSLKTKHRSVTGKSRRV